MSKLQKVKEALEFYADKYSWGKEDELLCGEDRPWQEAKEALAELNDFMERLESDVLIDEIVLALAITRSKEGAEYKDAAQAVINVIKGGDDDYLHKGK